MTSIKQIRPRIGELEIIRGLAFLAVVFQHASGIFMRKTNVTETETFVTGVLFILAKFAVPAFVFISGMVLFYNYREKLDFSRFITKRLKEILVPYVLWTILFSLFYHRLRLLLPNLVTGEGAYHLWYPVMILQLYLLFPLLRWIVNRYFSYLKNPSILLIATGILYIGLIWVAKTHPSVFGQGDLYLLFVKYRGRNALFYLFYFILGAVAGIYIDKWREILQRFRIPLTFLFLIVFTYVLNRYLLGGKVDVSSISSLTPTMFVYTVLEILAIYNAAISIEQTFTKIPGILNFIGKYSFGAYLVHPLFLDYTSKGLAYFSKPGSYILTETIAFAVCAVLSVLFSYMISRIQYVRILVGVYGKRNK